MMGDPDHTSPPLPSFHEEMRVLNPRPEPEEVLSDHGTGQGTRPGTLTEP